MKPPRMVVKEWLLHHKEWKKLYLQKQVQAECSAFHFYPTESKVNDPINCGIF